MTRPRPTHSHPLVLTVAVLAAFLASAPSSSSATASSAISRRASHAHACCFLGRPLLLLFTGPYQDHHHGAPSALSSAPSSAGHPRPLVVAAAAAAAAAGENATTNPSTTDTNGGALLLSEGRTAGGSSHPDEHVRTFYRADPATGQLQHGSSVGDAAGATLDPVAPSAAGLAQSTEATITTESPRRPSSFPGLSGPVRWAKRVLRSVFLPVGWPGSVAPEYLRFQGFNIVQDLSTYLRGILATKAILEGMGVGRDDTTPIAATIMWIMRDGASMMSGLFFTTLMSSDFSRNAKSWRLFGDFIVDVGITLDMLAPLFPKHFLQLICLASVAKSLCGISAGAANGAIVEHFSRNNNIAEVLAKGGAQHTAVSLAGLAASFSFARYANASPRRVWAAYVALTVIHLAANYAAMRTLAFKSLNRRRLAVVLHAFCGSSGSVPTPAEAARKETIVPSPIPLPGSLAEAGRFLGKRVRLGVRVKEVAANAAELQRLQQRLQGEAYLLNATPQGTVMVALREDSTNLTALKACLHAYLYKSRSNGLCGAEAATTEGRLEVVESTHEEVCKLFPRLEKELRARGWDLDRVLLSPRGWTYRWG